MVGGCALCVCVLSAYDCRMNIAAPAAAEPGRAAKLGLSVWVVNMMLLADILLIYILARQLLRKFAGNRYKISTPSSSTSVSVIRNVEGWSPFAFCLLEGGLDFEKQMVL